MKKFFIYLTSYIMIGTIITIAVLLIVDSCIYNISNETVYVSSSNTYTKTTKSATNKYLKIKLSDAINYNNIDISYDNKYYIYIKDNKVYINELEKNTNIRVISSDHNIVYAKLLYDKNRIMYFTEEKKNNSSKLRLYSYEISSGVTTDFNTFNVSNFDKVIEVYSSPVINILYIDINTKDSSNNDYRLLYRIDLFNSMYVYARGINIQKCYMLQRKDRLYYEDNKGNIYVSGKKLYLFKESVNLIGIDEEDVVYFLNTNKDTVYKVKNNVISEKISLNDKNVVDTYCNHKKVYLVYGEYVVDLTSSDITEKIAKLSNYVNFLAIKGDNIYLKLNTSTLIKTNIKK